MHRVPPSLCLLFMVTLASLPSRAADVLYCADGVQGTDAMSQALAAFTGDHNVVETTVADCENQLSAGGWEMVILALQAQDHGLSEFPLFEAYVNTGGLAILQDRFGDPDLGALFEVAYGGATNQQPVSISHADLTGGLTNPMGLADPGWSTWSFGMDTTTGEVGATFPNGEAAVVIGNGGATIANGFTTDAPHPTGDGTALYTNEIMLLVSSVECFVDTDCDDDDVCNGTETCVDRTCVAGTPLTCQDDDPCTDDLCDPFDGCTFPYNTAPCDDTDLCTMDDSCDGAGACAGVDKTSVPVSQGGCDDDNPCTLDACDAADGTCLHENQAVTCDDGLWCTVDDICMDGVCSGTPRECDPGPGPCQTGVCNEETDSCEVGPAPDGTPCDDGSFCTVSDSCSGGSCGGETRDCSVASDQCNTGVCDEATDACVGNPLPDGTVCEDGQFCTAGDSCAGGLCNPGAPRDCSQATDQCNTGVCDEEADACVGDPVPDGSVCNDGQFCTLNDTCQAGTCSGAARDCSYVADQCNQASCNEATGACEPVPLPDGTACDDASPCTLEDGCTAGVCGGAPVDCSAAGDQCNHGVCNPADGTCEPQPVPDGTACEDGLFCTHPDTCQVGACTGGPARDCSAVADDCNQATCNEDTDSCYQVPLADGLPCDDGDPCTLSDACSGGACVGNPRDCGWMSDQCNQGVCDPASGACVLQPAEDGTACDDGVYCTGPDTCTAGDCGGPPRDCSAAADQCNLGVCNEVNRRCDAVPVADGTVCEDGLFCHHGEVCVGGDCIGGGPRDCSHVADACNQASCNEDTDNCEPVPLPDGTACDDGSFCTVSDVCSAGSCLGAARDCSQVADPCNMGICDENTDQCVQDPMADGTACDDGDACTMDDACNGGLCIGVALDADADGYVDAACGGADCNDDDAGIYPGAEEICGDGIDQDCNGMDLACACPDADDDGFEDEACGGRDCDDDHPGVHPDADEICNDGIDNDCDGDVDADDIDCFCQDADGDGFPSSACGGTDCDDSDPFIHPNAPEVCDDGIDNDCDGLTDEDDPDCFCPDADGDGFADATCGGTDCDDEDEDIHPGANEVCGDGIDQDCDGEDPACACPDADGDGFQDAACGGGDCDDDDDRVNPEEAEQCQDGMDNDCDGLTDRDDPDCFCPDADGDGYQDEACGGDDCADGNPAIHPGAEEICDDGLDNDCDGLTDDQDMIPCPPGENGGCGCGWSRPRNRGTGGGAGFALLALVGLVLRRRRRDQPQK